ncbi:MAG TPA: ATP-binding protein [Opitutaceae bacterium]
MAATTGSPDPRREPTLPTDAERVRLFNLSRDLLCIAGLDGYFKQVNPSWTRVLGWSEQELLSRPVVDFMHPDDRERTLQARSVLANGTPIAGLENRYLCKDGSYRWLSWQSTSEPGAATVFGVARDITERRQADHERLILGKLESTGVLAGGIAHDFNNLLTSILLNLEMVELSGEVSERQRTSLRQAEQSVHAAKAITQQLLTFARGDGSTRRVVDLRELMEQSLALALSGSNIRSECVIDPELWPAEIDEAQIGHALRSLVLNAREAMPDGGLVRLTADNVELAEPTPAGLVPGHYVRIRIRDGGAGISPEIQARIFDPYFSTKQRGAQKGMGLGLTICHSVLKKHRGQIAVESEEGKGTTVICLLPATRQRPPAIEPAPSVMAGGSGRVLVMDDEAFIREILSRALVQLGYEVVLAADGAAAVSCYDEAQRAGRPVSVVLLDLTVRGGMGGAEAMRLLRARSPDVQAILMTGQTNEPAFRDFATLGFKGVLPKPFSLEKLRATLSSVPAGLA